MEPFQLSRIDGGPQSLLLREWMDKFPGLSAGFTTRAGGASDSPWQSLNTAFHVGDREQDVAENRRRAAEAAGFPFEGWTCAEQVHGDRIELIGAAERGRGRLSRADALQDTDGLITEVPGVMLAAFFADCVPLYVVDPVRRVAALAHAGWKGTAANIAEKTIRRMQDAYGCEIEHLRAAIGPSIGPCCYEVDERVIAQIDVEPPQRKENGRYMLDLKEANRQFMIRAGIQPVHIKRSNYCTACRTDLFFSHRAEQGKTGRMAAWIGWKSEVTPQI